MLYVILPTYVFLLTLCVLFFSSYYGKLLYLCAPSRGKVSKEIFEIRYKSENSNYIRIFFQTEKDIMKDKIIVLVYYLHI